MTPPIISIVSKKRSGKTTLIERLIPELIQRGYQVGTLKHDTHGFSMDHEGKDTWRHKRAGARTIAISSPWQLSIIMDVEKEISIDSIATNYYKNVDIIITEGYVKAGKPQIEVFRSEAHDTPLAIDDTRIALVTDTALDLGVPVFELDDICGIANFVIEKFLKFPE
jgi:molybdopterin-guanine dinucleotide biosynthesis adapter protein